MIARIWQGRSRPGMGSAYFAYLQETGVKGYRATEGFRDLIILTREIGKATEYVVITFWDSMEAIRRFAGPEAERAVYYPEDDRYFAEKNGSHTFATTRYTTLERLALLQIMSRNTGLLAEALSQHKLPEARSGGGPHGRDM